MTRVCCAPDWCLVSPGPCAVSCHSAS
jgi:hypothetical protein